MKKIKYLLLLLISGVIFPNVVSAASGSISVSSNATTVVKGNTVTVTVKLSSNTEIGSWIMDLSYDASVLQLTSSSAEAGGTRMANSSAGITYKDYTFKFKTLKTGSTSLSVNSYQIIANDMSEMQISSSSKTITVKTQAEIEASYSKDNYLKGLTVEGYEISPAFDKEISEYTVEVPEGTKEINIGASVNDSRSSVEGSGTLAVTPGINNFDITVRAQNGSERVYKLIVNVIDQNPIPVTVEGDNKTVVKLREQLVAPTNFIESTVVMGEFEIPAYTNDKLSYTLVGLKDEEGLVELYIYDEDKDTYAKYIEYKFNGLMIVPIETTKTLDGYTKYTETIFGNSAEVLKLEADSEFWVVYGKSVLTGEEGFYTYDSKNESVIAYDAQNVDEVNDDKELYLYVIMGLSGFIILLFIIIFGLMRRNKKKSKKQQTEGETKEDIKESKPKKEKEKKKKKDEYDF